MALLLCALSVLSLVHFAHTLPARPSTWRTRQIADRHRLQHEHRLAMEGRGWPERASQLASGLECSDGICTARRHEIVSGMGSSLLVSIESGHDAVTFCFNCSHPHQEGGSVGSCAEGPLA